MFITLPSSDTWTEVMGSARTVSLETKLATLYDGQEYSRPDKLARKATGKKISVRQCYEKIKFKCV